MQDVPGPGEEIENRVQGVSYEPLRKRNLDSYTLHFEYCTLFFGICRLKLRPVYAVIHLVGSPLSSREDQAWLGRL